MRKVVVVVGLLAAYFVSFSLQSAFWGLFYSGLGAPLKFFAIISLCADLFFLVGYALRRPSTKLEANWKPTRSIDEHGAEFMTEQDYRFRRLYPSGKPTYPN